MARQLGSPARAADHWRRATACGMLARMNFAPLSMVATALLFVGALAIPPERDWAVIAGPSRSKLPQPQSKVVWRTDLAKALEEARAASRPLFVTLRCLPCKQCADFDAAVLEGGGALDPLLAQFVTVRLTDVKALDLRLFPVEGWQDLDLSWWGYLLSPQAQIYSIFGGKDHVSDSSRISTAALAKTLERVLEHHYDPRRAEWNVDGPVPVLAGRASTPLDLPGAASWRKRPGAQSLAKDGCLHCHQVNEILRQPALDARSFDKRRELDMWPLPENIGLELERDDGLLVKRVAPESAAARAGLRAGDRLAVAGERKLFGQADLRGVLHRGPRGAGELELRVWRGRELVLAKLELREGWRATLLGWRKSIADGNIGAVPGFSWPLEIKPAERAKRGLAAGKMAVKPWFGQNSEGLPAYVAGLRADDVIVAVGGESPDLAQREFMTWFRLKYEPGDEVVLTVRNTKGTTREVRYIAPRSWE